MRRKEAWLERKWKGLVKLRHERYSYVMCNLSGHTHHHHTHHTYPQHSASDQSQDEGQSESREKLVVTAEELLKKWEALKEVFRIPKRTPQVIKRVPLSFSCVHFCQHCMYSVRSQALNLRHL